MLNSSMLIIAFFCDRFMIDQNDWLYCSADTKYLIYVNGKGANYITFISFQYLFIANMIKVVLYEGAVKARAFGESTPEITYCLKVCYCFGWTPNDEVFDGVELPKRNFGRANDNDETPDITAEYIHDGDDSGRFGNSA